MQPIKIYIKSRCIYSVYIGESISALNKKQLHAVIDCVELFY